MPTHESSRSLVTVMTQIASDLGYLVQTEIRLARAEIGENLSGAASGALYLAAGAVVLMSGLVVLWLAAAEGLTVAGLAYPWSLLVVAVAVLIVGGILAAFGAGRMRAGGVAPGRTLEQMRRDYAMAKEHVR